MISSVSMIIQQRFDFKGSRAMNKQGTDSQSKDSKSINHAERILIVGIDGSIGSSLFTRLPPLGFEVYGTSRNRSRLNTQVLFLDLENPNLSLLQNEFSAAIICASVTNILTCESDPVQSRKINVIGTIALIDSLIQSGCFVIFLSTNAVFDGGKAFATIEDIPNPITNYGYFKREVEIYLEESKFGSGAILRLTKLMTNDARFLVGWRDLASNNQPIPAFINTMLSHITIEEVISSIYNILGARESGTFQLGGLVEESYFDFAVNHFRDSPASLALLVESVDPSVPPNTIRHNSLLTVLPNWNQTHA